MNTEFAIGGGFAVVVAGVLIKFLLEQVKTSQQTIATFLVDDTRAKDKLSESLRELTIFLRSNHD